MEASERQAVIERVFDEFNNEGTVEVLFEQLAEDVRLRLTIEPGTPMSGDFHGKEGVRRYFEAYDEILGTSSNSLTTPKHVVTDILAADDKVVALGHETIIVKRTGAERTHSQWATVFTFRDDEIVDILVIENTAVIAMAYPGLT
jgi:ketosteroid isomerase-like protein